MELTGRSGALKSLSLPRITFAFSIGCAGDLIPPSSLPPSLSPPPSPLAGYKNRLAVDVSIKFDSKSLSLDGAVMYDALLLLEISLDSDAHE